MYTCVRAHVYVYAYMSVHTYMHTCSKLYRHMHMHVYSNAYVYAYVYMCMHTHIMCASRQPPQDVTSDMAVARRTRQCSSVALSVIGLLRGAHRSV